MTIQQIVDEAMGTNTRNREAMVSPTELLRVVRRSLPGYYADAVEVNRWYYARRFQVGYDGARQGWPRPAGVEAVVRIETVAGDEVGVVRVDHRLRERGTGMGAVYEVGRVFYPAPGADGPAPNQPLVFFCSVLPQDPVTLADELDESWPSQFNALLVYDLASYLARKDGGREAEVAFYGEEHKKEYGRYLQHLRHSTLDVRSSHSGGAL